MSSTSKPLFARFMLATLFLLAGPWAPSLALAQVCPALEAMPFPPPVLVNGPQAANGPWLVDDGTDVPVGEPFELVLGGGAPESSLTVSIFWAQTTTDCGDPLDSVASQPLPYDDVGFTLVRPDGAELPLVQPGDWTGVNTQVGFFTSFVDTGPAIEPQQTPGAITGAASPSPYTRVFAPSGDPLDSFLEGGSTGSWQLLATDTTPGSPVCVFDWELEVK